VVGHLQIRLPTRLLELWRHTGVALPQGQEASGLAAYWLVITSRRKSLRTTNLGLFCQALLPMQTVLQVSDLRLQ